MKYLKVLWVFFGSFLLASASFAQDQTHAIEKLKYLADTDLDKGMNYAMEQGKPMMIYFNSWDCASCEKYAVNVMSVDTIENLLKSKYVCVKANIKNGDASAAASEYGVNTLPQIILVSRDQQMFYPLSMKLDVDLTAKQANWFLNTMYLRDQILLYQKTNAITFEQAAEAMAASYARRDFKKEPEADVEEMVKSRCLKMKQFDKFAIAYKNEWQIQKTKKAKQK